MIKKRYGWIAAISLGIMIAGCGNNASSVESFVPGIYQGKAIKGVSDVAWKYQEFQSPPYESTVTEKAVYVGDSKNIYSIDTKTGKKLWMHQINGMISRPAVTKHIVSFIDNTGVHTLNADSGELLWEHLYKKEVLYAARSAVTTASSDHVFIIERLEDGRPTLKALDIKTGEESWNYGDNISFNRNPLIIGDKLYIPSTDQVHVLSEKTGKETDSIKLDAMIDNISVSDNLLVAVFADADRSIHGFDLKSHEQIWEYILASEDGVRPSRLDIIRLKDKVLITDVKSGTVVMLDSKGKELWKKKLGNPVFGVSFGRAITPPIVADDSIYISVWEGQNKELKGMPGFSSIVALDVITGNEQWRYHENDFINYSPSLIDNGMIVVTKNGLKAYKGGKSVEGSVTTSTKAESTKADRNPELKAFEGQWSTPGSDELAFNLSFTDDSSGVITFYSQGAKNPTPFKYGTGAASGSIGLLIGSEEKAVVLVLYDSGELGYRDNNHRYTLVRSDVSQLADDAAAKSLISGFKGKWCDSAQELCFEIVLDEDESGGYLNYYQEKEPYQESFKIPYMDEYEIVIELEAGSSQVRLDLSEDKKTLTYESDFKKATMKKQ